MFDSSFLLWFLPPFVATFLAAAVTVVMAQRGATSLQRMLVMSSVTTVVWGIEAIFCPHFWLRFAAIPTAILAAIATVVLFRTVQREDIVDR